MAFLFLVICGVCPVLSSMGCTIEVLFTPADFRALRQRDFTDAMCVVFDVLRATSVMVTALANDAVEFIPAEEITEAIALKRERPDALLAGERDGLRITSALTRGVEFDLGNSPREFTPEKVRGRTIISTTTNGTRALRACLGARSVIISSFLNLSATAQYVIRRNPRRLLLVCAGTAENAALEDTLAAGALCERISNGLTDCEVLDSAEVGRRVYQQAHRDLLKVVRGSQNARRLLANADLRADVEFCLQQDSHSIIASMGADGIVRCG